MPKQLVTAIGLIVCIGVIALGVFLVALPLYFQAINVDVQTASVSGTNDVYQSQVDYLREEEQNLEAINANVAQLRSQIPATGQYDDVFEIIGRAASSSGVELTSVTAGTTAAFLPRTDPTAEAPAPAATAEPSEEETATESDGADSSTPAATEPTSTGRQQVDFVISATADDMDQITAFLDAMRSGPRILTTITTTSLQNGEGSVDLEVAALTYMEVEG